MAHLKTLPLVFFIFAATNIYSQDDITLNGIDSNTKELLPGASDVLPELWPECIDGESAIPVIWRTVLAKEKDIIKLAEDFTDSLKKKILQGKT